MSTVTQKEFTLPSDVVILSASDLEGRITEMNEGFIVASGYKKEELVGQPHSMFLFAIKQLGSKLMQLSVFILRLRLVGLRFLKQK